MTASGGSSPATTRRSSADMRALRDLGVGAVDFSFDGDTADAVLANMRRFREDVLAKVERHGSSSCPRSVIAKASLDPRCQLVGSVIRSEVLKLGYKASAEQFGPRELLDFSCLAEEVGFDSVFVSDHFQPWKHTDGHAPNSLAWLGALGARTRRVDDRHQRR